MFSHRRPWRIKLFSSVIRPELPLVALRHDAVARARRPVTSRTERRLCRRGRADQCCRCVAMSSLGPCWRGWNPASGPSTGPHGASLGRDMQSHQFLPQVVNTAIGRLIAIDWARYAELFAYDDRTRTFSLDRTAA